MTIAPPIITDFDKENIAPWAGNRLIDLRMATLPSKPITRFFLNYKQKKSLGYQKLRPRYEPMDETTKVACEPLCQEGWYFDCETETCKEYSSYVFTVTSGTSTITLRHDNQYTGDIIPCDLTYDYHSVYPNRYSVSPNTIPEEQHIPCNVGTLPLNNDFCSPCTDSSYYTIIITNNTPNYIKGKITGLGSTNYLIGSYTTTSQNFRNGCNCNECYGGMWEEDYVESVLGDSCEAYHELAGSRMNTFNIYGVK